MTEHVGATFSSEFAIVQFHADPATASCGVSKDMSTMSLVAVDAEKITIPTASTSRGCHHHLVDRNLSTLRYHCWPSRITARKVSSAQNF